jgi:hypothetical protein
LLVGALSVEQPPVTASAATFRGVVAATGTERSFAKADQEAIDGDRPTILGRDRGLVVELTVRRMTRGARVGGEA